MIQNSRRSSKARHKKVYEGQLQVTENSGSTKKPLSYLKTDEEVYGAFEHRYPRADDQRIPG